MRQAHIKIDATLLFFQFSLTLKKCMSIYYNRLLISDRRGLSLSSLCDASLGVT